MSLDQDLVLEILDSHFSDTDWVLDDNKIYGSVEKDEDNLEDNFDIELIFSNDIIKLSKISYSNYKENGKFAGIKITILSDVCNSYDDIFDRVKEFVNN